MALVIRRVDDPMRTGRRNDMLQVLVLPLDLAQDRVERVLKRPVDRISLLGLQLIEIPVDPIAGVVAFAPVPEVLDDVFARQHSLSDIIQH